MENKINFKSYDGTNLVGIISIPAGAKKAMLMMHGLPSNKDEWGFYKDMAAHLYKRGVATFRFDYRYNGESQKGDLSMLTMAEMINDIESAYWKLKETIPGAEVFGVGSSSSGGVLIKWINLFKRKISKAFLTCPVLDYEYEITGARKKSTNEFYELSSNKSVILFNKKRLNDDVGYGYQILNEAHLFDIKKELTEFPLPVTIFHGNEDTTVPIIIVKESIKDFKNVELLVLDKANHGFAVEGDEDLTAEGTKRNHFYVYDEILKRV